MSDRLREEREGDVVVLTLAAPELLNRFDEELHEAFIAALAALHDSGARAAVLAAEGQCFSAGGDVEFMQHLHDDPELRRRASVDGRRMIDAVVDLPMPLVAAVQGDAIGLGATIVLGCDVVVASRGARLADPHVLFGLVAGDGGAVMWPQAIGLLRARRYLLTGDRVDAERAFEIGIVTDLVDEPGDVLPAAMAIAGRIAALPPLGVQGTKRALAHVLRRHVDEVLPLSIAYEIETLTSDDLVEAISAFRERRPGRYRGA